MTKKIKPASKKDLYKAMKGSKSPQQATKVIPNKKKHNAKSGIAIQFDNADLGIGSGE